MSIAELRQSPMMAHLLDALDRGEDIGHYGRLAFAMIGRHFLDREELVDWLKKDPDMDEREAKALVQQVEARDYNPPSRRTILEWQGRQAFPICPTPDDPDACNPYQELPMPEGVLEDIEAYRERQFDAEEEQEHAKG
jgi:DNA primase large subunit